MQRHYAMGWQRDLPDFRDKRPEDILKNSKALKGSGAKIGTTCDLSQWCSSIENQGEIGSCTANAGVGLLEYYEKRAFGRYLDASRLFLYKTTRNLLGWSGDTGAWLRTTMSAMVFFGIPPEKYWSYDTANFDKEPAAFHYSFAQNYKSIRYFRLDQPNMPTDKLLQRVKQFLAAGFPSMFGFTVYNFGNDKGEFAYPDPDTPSQGGHAIVAIGYDDNRKIGTKKGAFKIRNSWGKEWGEGGYGWLPYAYVEAGLAVDFWSLFKAEYIDTKQFD